MKNKYRAAIFDLDGTLVNSICDLANAGNLALKKNGYPVFESDEYKHFVGRGVEVLIEKIIPNDKKTKENLEKLHCDFVEFYSENFNDKTIPYDEIEDVLDELKRQGVTLCVASNKPDSFVKKIIEGTFKPNIFTLSMGHIDGVDTKPSPKIVENILGELSLKSDEVVFIGDTDVDIETGKNAKVKTIGCLWGFRDFKELNDAGADFIASTPKELIGLIL